MATTQANWAHAMAYPVACRVPQRRQLGSVVLSPLPAGVAVLGPSAVSDERGLLMRGEHVCEDVIFNALVWDHDRHLQWEGDLDLVVHAPDLERLADLLGTPVHVIQRHTAPLSNGHFRRLQQPRLVGTVYPAPGTSPSLLAQLSKLNALGVNGIGDGPVLWKPRGRDGTLWCEMDFSPGARRRLAAREAPEDDRHTYEAACELRDAIMGPINRFGLCHLGEPLMHEMVDDYVRHALAYAVTELRHLGRWLQA